MEVSGIEAAGSTITKETWPINLIGPRDERALVLEHAQEEIDDWTLEIRSL